MAQEEKFTLPTPEEVQAIQAAMPEDLDLPSPEEVQALSKEIGFGGEPGPTGDYSDVIPAAMVGTAYGATGTFMPEIEAAIGPTVKGVTNAMGLDLKYPDYPDAPGFPTAEEFGKRAEMIRKTYQEQLEKAPVAGFVGEMVGLGLGPGKISAKVAKGAKGTRVAKKVSDVAEKVGKAGKLGKAGELAIKGAGLAAVEAPIAYVEGLGYTPTSETIMGMSKEERMAQAELGALFGGAIPPSLSGAGVGVKAVGRKLKPSFVKGLSAIFGPHVDMINKYLERPELFDKAVPAEDMIMNARGIVQPILKALDEGKINLAQAKKEINDIEAFLSAEYRFEHNNFKDTMRQIEKEVSEQYQYYYDSLKMVRPPLDLDTKIVASIDDLQNRVKQGNEAALDIAIDEMPEIVPVEGLTDIIEDEAQKYLYSTGPNAGQPNPAFADWFQSIEKWKMLAEYLETNGSNPRELKKIIQNLRKKTTFRKAGAVIDHTPAEEVVIKRLAAHIDHNILKKHSPGYRDAMSEVSRDMQLLDQVKEYMDDPQKRMNFLNRIDAVGNTRGRNILISLGETTGRDFREQVEEYLAVKNEMKLMQTSKAAQDEFKQELLVATGRSEEYNTAKAEIEARKKINAWEQKKQIEQQAAKTEQAEAYRVMQDRVNLLKRARDHIHSFNKNNVEARLKALIRSFNPGQRGMSVEVRQDFKKLSEIPEQFGAEIDALRSYKPLDFVEAAEAAQLRAAFDQSFRNGSSNVNLWGTIGGSTDHFLSSRSQMGGAAGGASGTVAGVLIGMGVGKYLDAYGPETAKRVLDGVLSIRGIVNKAKIMNLDLPPDAKAQLVRDWDEFLGTGWTGEPIAVDPEDLASVREDIRRHPTMSPMDKAEIINDLNRHGQIRKPALIWGTPKPKEEKAMRLKYLLDQQEYQPPFYRDQM